MSLSTDAKKYPRAVAEPVRLIRALPPLPRRPARTAEVRGYTHTGQVMP
jgi:hypothetical protein